MVRETRHLWVGNLPDNIREDRIREHFKRYGRVQNVKLLGRTETATSGPNGVAVSGVCATVAFMDIKSASKAHNAEHVLDERTLTTEYYEPAAIPSAAGAPSAGSSPAGSGYSGSSSSVNSASVPPSNPSTVSRYHLSGGEEVSGTCALAATAAAPANWRGTNDSASEYCRRGSTPATYARYQRNATTAPYATPPNNVDRSTPHHRWYGSTDRERGESTPSTPGGGTETSATRRRRRSGSGSSRSDSTSPEPSDGSRASTPAHSTQAHATTAQHTTHSTTHASHASPSPAARTPPTTHHQWSSTASGRPLAICVRNLPTRSTDSSLKDGLYHEYKKHGKVVWVKVVGQNADRYAVVRFKKPSDVEKALEVSQDKLFFGCKISVAPHQSCDEDAETAKPYETDIDEYHPKATRTLFIGNLEKDVTLQQLREKFKHFGRIIEIDIKKGSSGGAGYAFCQYASISSVVDAIRAMDGEYVGGSRVKLGFGKPVATTCVWVDGLTEHTEKQVLAAISRCGAATSVCVDRAAGAALIHFEQAGAAGAAVRELRRVAAHATAQDPERPRLAVDYASRECQDAFYDQLEKHGGSAPLQPTDRMTAEIPTRYVPTLRHDPLSRYESCSSRSRASSYGRGSSRTPRYTSIEHYDPTDYATERRYRVYDEVGSSPQTEETAYEDRLQSVVVSPHRARRHRHDSSPEDRKHSKDRHRSSSGAGLRRSRSGSRCGSRHGGRRRHRRRREGSGGGTPLRDEPDAPPAEPRRPPRERPPLPMSLPLPRFAAQLMRAAPVQPRPAPAAAPDSPPRPLSASSSSAGSAPHSPSLEERIRSLDEKYEKWSGSRTAADAPDRARLRHRLLDIDIKEVKPSDVVRSLLAKRSVFDEDSERLEGAVRAPSPSGSPCGPRAVPAPRALRYPFPVHPTAAPAPTSAPAALEEEERPVDPRLQRTGVPIAPPPDRLARIDGSEYRRPRAPSTDHPPPPPPEEPERDSRRALPAPATPTTPTAPTPPRRRRSSLFTPQDQGPHSLIDSTEKDLKEAIEKIDSDFNVRERRHSQTLDKQPHEESANSYGSLFSISSCRKPEPCEDKKAVHPEGSITSSNDETDSRSEDIVSNQFNQSDHKKSVKTETSIEKESISSDESSVKSETSKNEPPKTPDLVKMPDLPKIPKTPELSKNLSQLSETSELPKTPELPTTPELPKTNDSTHSNIDHNAIFQNKSDSEKCKEIIIQNHINRGLHEFEIQHSHLNPINSFKTAKDISELSHELLKGRDKNGKERFNQNIILEAFHTKLEKENIEIEKISEKEKYGPNSLFSCEKKINSENTVEERVKHDREKEKHGKDRVERHDHEKDKSKSCKPERSDKSEKERKSKDDPSDKGDKIKTEKEYKEKSDREIEKSHKEEKSSRHSHEHHKKDKNDKEKRKENDDRESKLKKDDRHKHEKKGNEAKAKKEESKSRKSSRDESNRDLCRKDSTDSSASRASHESTKLEQVIKEEIKEEKVKAKHYTDIFIKEEIDKEIQSKLDPIKIECSMKVKTEIKEEKDLTDHNIKNKSIGMLEPPLKLKADTNEKQRHYSLDSPSVECKRKERLNSSSSLPSNIGHKRRMSSQDSLDSSHEDHKKTKNEPKVPQRRDSKDSRSTEKHKTTKFSKGHFAKILESKTKDDKKNQVKTPDDSFKVVIKEEPKESKDHKMLTKQTNHEDSEERGSNSDEQKPEGLPDFLATLELRSSEEDERQKALRKEMKEKKRIQQLQQIQELQMQQDALHQAELMGKLKDEKKHKEDKKKEAAREKRMSTDRKSRDEKSDSSKRKSRKQMQSTDSSESDEPKKHSIFDIVEDEPMYISMYDKVKARSCKNMQKQEEEKRQEKIKAKFSQLKQSRAKREEKKRSSWDEDSDSDQDRRKPQKLSMDSTSEDDQINMQNKKRDKSRRVSHDFDRLKSNDIYNMTSNEEDSRNKLSRKNSRTRIISDTSDDDFAKRSIGDSPNLFNNIRKEIMADIDGPRKSKDDGPPKDQTDKIKKNSLLNLFGKSDSEDNKYKMSLEINDNKPGFVKTMSNDFSSESESTNRIGNEQRKKHKKKQRKHKFSFSDDESKIESSDVPHDSESKHKSEKFRRHHGAKKERRKDKTRESIEMDDDKTKIKKDKKLHNLDSFPETLNIKKDGKMEDIFGPLSDESDRELGHQSKLSFSSHDYESCHNEQFQAISNTEEVKLKEKDENRRKKEKKKKERRPFIKEDENSLDVDAVSKAIEERLFADALNDDEGKVNMEALSENLSKNQQRIFNFTESDINDCKLNEKHGDKTRRDSKEKKKKKKKNREDRRRDHHHSSHADKYDKTDFIASEKTVESLSPKSMLLDIPLPADTPTINLIEKEDDHKSLTESPSLPRLTDSPPAIHQPGEKITKRNISDTSEKFLSDHDMDVEYIGEKTIAVTDIPMPPPFENNIVKDISEVPLPKEPAPKSDPPKLENVLPTFGIDTDTSEDAVRSITNLEKDEKQVEKHDSLVSKVEKKVDEKPRAVISQEETADAVAALLGESFGGKDDSFSNCYEEVESNSTHQNEIETSTVESETTIPEEDAEEMRRAVQNLNACEMEMKPDTPLSDNDLLLIDTDTEEAEETSQDGSADRQSTSLMPISQSSMAAVTSSEKPVEMISASAKIDSQSTASIETNELPAKSVETEIKSPPVKRDIPQQPTSTSTPVIQLATPSWTLNNKLLEPHVVNIQSSSLANRDSTEKPTHITANIVQIKAPNGQGIATSLRPIITPNRVSAPYQVFNHMIRSQAPANMQPPTIKIPEQHIIGYQKSPSIVISPRTSDPRQQSPKASPQGEGMTSPRLANMTILSTSPQNLNSVGIVSPNNMQQRSPGQVTVVRMQQPPLSPIQSMHLPPGARAMVSPNRPNSVLVQTQGGPIHFNRLPVTPVLAPISKQMSANNIVQQNKNIGVSTATLLHQQKMLTTESRIADQRAVNEKSNEPSKIILSPTSLQHSTNPTVMAQNRLISMQNAMHAASMNSQIHLANKVLINNSSHLGEKRDNTVSKSEQHNHLAFGSAPIIHVANVKHSSASIIQSGSKPIMCTLQDANAINRAQNTNVIHSLNSQRPLSVSGANIIHLEPSKSSPSVLSMAAIRTPTVLTKIDTSNATAVATTSVTNVTPFLLKTTTPSNIRLSSKNDAEQTQTHTPMKIQNNTPQTEDAKREPPESSNHLFDTLTKQRDVLSATVETLAKCETDFEELLKDSTNEIKITNNTEKKLEVNVGKTVTLISPIGEKKQSIEILKEELSTKPLEKTSLNPDIKETPSVALLQNTTLESKQSCENKAESKVTVIDDNNSSKPEEKSINSIFDKLKKETIHQEIKVDPKKSEDKIFGIESHQSESGDSNLKSMDENDSWSAKDINIESVIKKVDSLCNDVDMDKKDEVNESKSSIESSQISNASESTDSNKLVDSHSENDSFFENQQNEEFASERTTCGKRGGRSVRGKKIEKQDRVQTRQIAKPARGGTAAKRGRGGRAKVDKKIKDMVNHSANNIPGDVYDFHDDSGDESATATNKSEARPRLILTIKSPISGQSNVTPTSTLTVAQKDQLKMVETANFGKDEKAEDFVAPSANTRKSRRLQEKDVSRTTVDDIIEDVVKGTGRGAKEPKKRQTRQAGAKANQGEKAAGSDTRKSPRGVKRTRDRSLSDTSLDSGSDERVAKREEAPKEPKDSKVPKLAEAPPAPARIEPDPPQAAKTMAPTAPVALPPVVQHTPSTPIMKPPKKMISEISAKLASAFEAAASGSATVPPPRSLPPERIPMDIDKRPPPTPQPLTINPIVSDHLPAATGEVRVNPVCGAESVGGGGEALVARRAEGTGGPVGGSEADSRVQSPALPHRLADRATPLLMRADAEPPRLARSYAAASLPRGAACHVPPPPSPHAHALPPHATLPAQSAHPAHPVHPAHPTHPAHAAQAAHSHPHPHPKQVAIVGPHHHHAGTGARVTITTVPSISPQGQIAMGDGMYPHFSHQHYQMYQQHFRATQHDSRATPSPYTRSLEAEGCEAPTPPLELRRPPSARVPRPAHSPAPAPAPSADRHIMYAAGCGRSPPPAHGTSRLPSALPPTAAPGPPHASQVPREADSLQMLLRRYPVMWQGLLALKNDSAAVQMHFVGGNPGVAGDTLPRHTDGSTPPLRIAQRMRLEPTQLDQVHRKMKLENEHCMLLALPCGRDHMDVLQQSTNLSHGFITYLQRKQAAGIVNVAPPGHHQAMYTVHIFPSCDFANENLNRIAPDLMHRVADIAHLLIVIATV